MMNLVGHIRKQPMFILNQKKPQPRCQLTNSYTEVCLTIDLWNMQGQL